MRQIDSMIDDLRRKQQSESKQQKKKKERLESRKVQALKRIGAAGVEHLGFGNNVKAEKIVQARLEEASKSRVSHAEAMADIAERGDFASELQWIDVRPSNDNSVSLWKGYCVKRVEARYRFRVDGIRAEIIVREIAAGGYVASLACRRDIASGVGETPEKAAERAYVAYCDLKGRDASDIPFLSTKLDAAHVAS